MGLDAGTTLRSDCGAEIVYVTACPDEALSVPRCACGCEFAIPPQQREAAPVAEQADA